RSGSDQDLRTAELATDKAAAVVQNNSTDPALRAKLDAASLQRLDALVKQADDFNALRRQIDEGQISRAAAFTAYNSAIDPYYGFFLGLNPLQSVELDRQARVLTEVSRAREAIGREDAIYSAALVSGKLTDEEQRQFTDAVAEQR